MMTTNAALHMISVLVALSVGSAASAALASVCTTDGAKTVGDAVHAFYEAERTGAGAQWRALTTPDFRMFHEGDTSWTPDRFEKWIDREHAALQQDKAARFTMDLTDLKISIDCTTALTTQVLHSVVDMPSRKEQGHFEAKYQESLWLRKVPGAGWRVAFWHVTKMQEPEPASRQK